MGQVHAQHGQGFVALALRTKTWKATQNIAWHGVAGPMRAGATVAVHQAENSGQ